MEMNNQAKRERCEHCETERAHNSVFCTRCRCISDMKIAVMSFANSPRGLRNFVEQIETLNICTCRRLETIGQERDAMKMVGLAKQLAALQTNNDQPDLLSVIIPSLKQSAGAHPNPAKVNHVQL